MLEQRRGHCNGGVSGGRGVNQLQLTVTLPEVTLTLQLATPSSQSIYSHRTPLVIMEEAKEGIL